LDTTSAAGGTADDDDTNDNNNNSTLTFADDFDAILAVFLQNDVETSQRHLFVYVRQQPQVIACSLEAPSMQAVATLIVLCHNVDPQTPITSKEQLQCVTLLGNNTAAAAAAATSSTTEPSSSLADQQRLSILSSLHVLTKQCFLPTISSISTSTSTDQHQQQQQQPSNLQDKLKQFEIALQQTSLSTRLPQITLSVHPLLEAAALKKQQHPSASWKELLDTDTTGISADDDTFLNILQNQVNEWIVQIRRLTTLTNKQQQLPVFPESAVEEVAFWTQLSSALQSIQEQLKSPGVELTCSLLREAKRFVATLALENNTGMEQALAVTSDVTHFIQSYPLANIQASQTFESLVTAVHAVFDHLPKIRQSRYYSLDRACQLVEATSMTIKDVMLSILQEQQQQHKKNILFMDFKEYERQIHFLALHVFVQFEERMEEWKTFMMDQARKRKLTGMGTMLETLVWHHLPLKQRLEQLYEFRVTQEQLRNVVHAVLRQDDPEAIQQVEQAPRQVFSTLNVLDMTPGGSNALDAALEEYHLMMDAVEERLARLLRDKLQACKVRG
jgi:dynein heavy chain 1